MSTTNTSGVNRHRGSLNQIIKRETLYTGEHDLGEGLFKVEIILSTMDELVISSQHTQGPESFIIEIEPDKVEGLLNEFNGDCNLMASHLKIMNKRMVLLNPKFVGQQNTEQED